MKYKTNPRKILGICKMIPENKKESDILMELVWYLKQIDNDSCEVILDDECRIKCIYLYRIDK